MHGDNGEVSLNMIQIKNVSATTFFRSFYSSSSERREELWSEVEQGGNCFQDELYVFSQLIQEK